MKFLQRRAGRLHYVRRVPSDLIGLVGAPAVRKSLKTDDMEIAVQRLKKMNAATEEYWEALRLGGRQKDAEDQYEAAIKLSRAVGLRYVEMNDLISAGQVVERLDVVEEQGVKNDVLARAVLGAVDKPGLHLTDALEDYWTFTKDRLRNKNERQIRTWKNARTKAVANFVKLHGDQDISEISREDALDFRNWWLEQIDERGLTANSANKDFGHLRQILQVVSDMKRLGISGETNPFSGLRLEEDRASRPPFTVEQIKELLSGDKLSAMGPEGRCLFIAMVETGCRPSELCGLEEGDINLEADIPYIDIRPNETRSIKTVHSVRRMPLVGVSLKAMQEMPKGFNKYQGKNDTATAAVNKFMRENQLLPTPGHSLYSLRHSFEDPLTAVEPPEKVQAALMGHKYARPKYGDGPSLEQKREWLSQIALDVCVAKQI